MVIMASGIAHGCVRSTTTTESRNKAAILQITGWQRDMQPWFTVYFFGIGYQCYDWLIPVKTRYLLTSITWPYRRLKLTAHQGQVTADQVLVFPLKSRAHVWLTCWKQGRIVRKPVNAHPGLNVNRILLFLLCKCFCFFFVYMVIIETQDRRPNNIQKPSAQSYKIQIKILLFPGLV